MVVKITKEQYEKLMKEEPNYEFLEKCKSISETILNKRLKRVDEGVFRKLTNRIQNILEQIKGFSVGTSSNNDTKMIIDYEGSRFLVSFHQIIKPQDNMFDDIEKYL